MKQLNIIPTVGILAFLKNMPYNEWYALAEFVDNSIQSYLANKKKLKNNNPNFKLKIKINLLGSEIEIRDNAAGISKDRYDAAFETGKPPPDKTGLSEFGVGMKVAALWFSDKWSVITSALGEDFFSKVEFDMQKIQEKKIESLDVTTGKAQLSSSYTVIKLARLNHKPKGRSVVRIREHLSSMYRHMLNNNEIEIFIDNKKLKYEIPEIRIAGYYKDWQEGIIEKPKKIKWFKKFKFDFLNEEVTGYAAHRRKGRVSQEGFSLFRRGRLIVNSFKPVEIFGQGNDRKQQIIFGEVHLDNMSVAFSKNDFKWDDNDKRKFTFLLKESIEFIDTDRKKSFISQAKDWKEDMERDNIRKKTKSTLSEVSALVARGLEQSSSQKTKLTLPTKKHVISKENDKYFSSVNFEGKIWKIVIVHEYDKTADYVYDLEIADKKNEELKIFINLTHPFIARYFDNNTDGLAALISYFAIAEVQVYKFDGEKAAASIRMRFNSICQNLPPRSRI